MGREEEVEAVRERLGEARLVTLTGTGGIGKTRLAMQVAAEVDEELADGARFVELAALADPSLVGQAAAATLGVREEPGRPVLQTLCDALAPWPLLLVLDNCEHLLSHAEGGVGKTPTAEPTAPDCAALVEALLRHCPRLRVLATSREPLGVPGEVVWRVPPLSLPPPGGVQSVDQAAVAELMGYEAVQLFVERAVESRTDFALSSANLLAAGRICQQLDGIPLAIELAAARLKGLAAQQILDRLDDRFGLLTGGSRTALPRHRTLRAMLDWSYDALSGPEQALLCRLSVFAGGWTLEACEAVAGGEWKNGGMEERKTSPVGSSSTLPLFHSSTQPHQVLDLLTSLVDKSLVLCEEAGAARYRLLETVRQYAQERLCEMGEESTWRARHRDYYVELAEAAAPQLWGPEQPAWLERLETDHDNLRAALEFSLVEGPGRSGHQTLNHGEAALRLCGALWKLWQLHGYLGEGRQWCATALAQPAAGERTAARAAALTGAGVLAWAQGDYPAARALHEVSLAISRELGDRQGIAIALEGLAPAAVALGRPARAARLWGAAERLREEIGSPPPPTGQRRFARQVAAARAALGDDAAFDRAWQKG